MKTLQALQFGANNVLNREQLKKVTGGTVKPPDDCKNACTQDAPCTTGQVCTSAACPDAPTFTHYIFAYTQLHKFTGRAIKYCPANISAYVVIKSKTLT